MHQYIFLERHMQSKSLEEIHAQELAVIDVPGIILSTHLILCPIFSYLVFITIPWGRNSFYSHCTGGQAEVLQGKVVSPMIHPEKEPEVGFWTSLAPDPTLISSMLYCLPSGHFSATFHPIPKDFSNYFECVQWGKFLAFFSQLFLKNCW